MTSAQTNRETGEIVISSIERESAGIIGCKGFPGASGARGRDTTLHIGALTSRIRMFRWSLRSPIMGSESCVPRLLRIVNDGPDDRVVRLFRVLRISSDGKRAAAAILGGHPFESNS